MTYFFFSSSNFNLLSGFAYFPRSQRNHAEGQDTTIAWVCRSKRSGSVSNR